MEEKNELLKSMQDTYAECLMIANKKNKDYAGNEDPFKNFRNSLAVGVTPERAILVRLMDKLARVSNLIDKDPQVVDESIDDTIHDGINYLAILKAYRKYGNKN